MRSEQNYTDVLLEEMRGDIKAILEIVIPMRQELDEVKMLASRIPRLEADIRTIKIAVKDTNQQVQRHERIINRFLLSAEGV